MPELPEVERARKLIEDVGRGKVISKVETVEDTIVYTGGISHTDFAAELANRTIEGCERRGKIFFIRLSGEGRLPILHFGMTGMVQIDGVEPLWYQTRALNPKLDRNVWPPRFWKFILHLDTPDGSAPTVRLSFNDPRRLARIRLNATPLLSPPISELGFDPLLSPPTLKEFANHLSKKSSPIKAALLDQSFSAGVGNWVADEILFQSRIHPEVRCNTLTDAEVQMLLLQTISVCKTAVSVDADSAKFPQDWLFKHRWAKGRANKKPVDPLILADGMPAKVSFLTVGGRTSAIVETVQKLGRRSIKDLSASDKKRTLTQSADEASVLKVSEAALEEDDESKADEVVGRRKRRRL